MTVSFLRFLAVGLVSTAVNALMFFMLLTWLHVDYRISSVAGFLSGVVIGYVLNKRWTYSSSAPSSARTLVAYGSVYVVSMILSLAVIQTLVEGLSVSPAAANLLSICLTTLTNFLGTRFFVFPPDRG